MKKYLFYILFIFLTTTVLPQNTKNVFIVVIDGARYTETFGDSAKSYIPHLWNDLTPLGTLFTNFNNDGLTKTVSGHSSILTGTWQYLENDGSERPHNPTLFEYYRKEKNSQLSENFVVYGKDKLNVLAFSDHEDYGSSFGAAIQPSEEYNDTATMNNVKNVINAAHPKLMMINFPETDRKGHLGVWENYLTAIKQADSLVYDLWNFIQTDSIYRNNSTMIVTNDHGRHTNDFTSHGDTCIGCRHIMLLMIGPEIYKDKIDTTYYTQIDIAPTVAHLLDFEPVYSEGKIIDAFIPPTLIAEENFLPEEFRLFQNYPNPFNPKTRIKFSILKDSFVELSVYDILGRKLENLINKRMRAGYYETTFNGSNLASGVYFYKLQTDDNVIIKKMNLIK